MKYPSFAVMVLSIVAIAGAQEKGASSKPATDNTSNGKEAAAKQDPNSQLNDGVWKPIAAVLGGVRLPDASLAAITLNVIGNSYEVIVEGEREIDKGTCTFDTTTNPKRMTIKGMEGPNRGKTFLAIYEMKDADSMRVCYDLSGTEFPKDFKSLKGTPLYLAGYRRQKDQKGNKPTSDKQVPK